MPSDHSVELIAVMRELNKQSLNLLAEKQKEQGIGG